jgi:dTDP-4-amino-4,6-dideoxygalactose transaminase
LNPHLVTKQFETVLAAYTGARFVVAIDNCSNALFLCLKYLQVEGQEIEIPCHTYMSVPCSIIHAGAKVKFIKSPPKLKGAYQLKPTIVWDSALRFTKNMYLPGQLMCVSFSGPKKPLSLGKGGAILTDNALACEWFKRARYHGRHEINHLADNFDMLGWNFYMPNDVAARGLLRMQVMGDNEDIGQEYQDLSKCGVYK